MKLKNINIVAAVLLVILCAYILTPTSSLFQFLVNTERRFVGMELQKIQVGELEVEYLRGGKGEPLLLLHGFGADKDNWNRLAGHLTEDFDVIAIDLPGFGNSTSDIQLDYDVSSQVFRLNKIALALGLQQFNLAGNSMGGYIAGNYAAQFPDKVSNLWLISPFGASEKLNSEMFKDIASGKSPVVLPQNEAEFKHLFDFLFVEPPFVPAPIIEHLASRAEQRFELNSKIYQQIHQMKNGIPYPEYPLNLALQDYKGRVLITWGDKDRILNVSGAQILKQIMPHAQLDIATNVGHLPMMERPKETAAAFLSFVSPKIKTHD